MKRAKRTKSPCAIDGCWQPAKVAGLCGACYSWWGRVQLKTAGELVEYMKRQGRMESRLGRFGKNREEFKRPVKALHMRRVA